MREHTFAICAYGESPYLEECIKSVKNQTVKSEIILATSTPCDYIKNLCNIYEILYFINHGESGITQDWNFAYSKAETPIVTIAHQDDIYFRDYTEHIVKLHKTAKNPLIFFSDYCELRKKELVKTTLLLNIKRLMLFPLRASFLQSSIFVRRRILALGSPICCPSVAFFKNNLPAPIFNNHFRTNEDWEAWERISNIKGQFLYCKTPLMAHRIHQASETSAAIQHEGGRTSEDIEMYKKFWPEKIAVILSRWYKISENFNDLT